MFENNGTAAVVYDQVVNLFVDVPGDVIGGWVGFGIFIAAMCLSVWFWFAGLVPLAELYEVVGYTVFMFIVYLLAACEQFIFERDHHDDVNLLMVVTNCIVWGWLVLRTAYRVPNRPVPQKEKIALWIGISSQIIVFISVFVWNGAVFALWGFAFILMLVSILHIGITVTQAPNGTLMPYSVHWLFFSLGYTLAYVFFVFMTHLYLAVISLAGAVWGYLVLHLIGYVWLVHSSRFQRKTLVESLRHGEDTASFRPVVDMEAADVVNGKGTLGD